jgi:ABC-type branched-subunit amino acid transport system ATPase component
MSILELQQVSKSFDGIKAVDGVSLSFKGGKITGLIGPNGAGKTTLFHLITGFLRPDAGAIYYKGKRIDGLPPWRIAAEGIGRLFQDVRVFRQLTVLENVLVAFRNQPDDKPWVAFLPFRQLKDIERENLEKARYWVQFVGLEGMENVRAEDLSYGQQKLLAIARLLAVNIETLLLDEPTAGVNIKMIRVILDMIERLVKEERKTIIIIEHNMQIIRDIADWVYFMNEGKIISYGLPEEILENKEIRRIYMGIHDSVPVKGR